VRAREHASAVDHTARFLLSCAPAALRLRLAAAAELRCLNFNGVQLQPPARRHPKLSPKAIKRGHYASGDPRNRGRCHAVN